MPSWSDFRLAPGSAGGPVFTAGGGVVGITSIVDDKNESRRGASRVVRIDDACDVVASAEKKMKDAAPPDGTHLPVEPVRPFPVNALKDAAQRRVGSLSPYQMSSSDFDVAFMTPVLIYGAQYQSEQGRGRERRGGPRTPDAEPAVVRPLMDFGNWSEYVADFPPVLLIRVTPKLVESFWTTVARGAARTQGVSLPPIKHVKSGFSRMRVFCGDAEVTPIHPFKLEQRVSESDAIYEGLYVLRPRRARAALRDRQARAVFGEGAGERRHPAGRSEGAPADLAGLRAVSRALITQSGGQPYDSVGAQLYRESIRILHAQLVAFVIGRRTARLEVCRDGGFVELLADANREMIDKADGLSWADDQATLPEFHECASVPLCNFGAEDAVVELGRFRQVGDVEGHVIDAIASKRRFRGSGADRDQGQALEQSPTREFSVLIRLQQLRHCAFHGNPLRNIWS